jgi:hypothetical protein
MSQLNWIDGTTKACSVSRGTHSPVKLGDTISAKVTPLEARPSKGDTACSSSASRWSIA